MESGTPDKARYDEISEWYVSWIGASPGLIFDPQMEMMPATLRGQRWLDLACGAGRASRELARRGADVVGVDISARLIALAEAEQQTEPLSVTYQRGDVARTEGWWDGTLFDGAICEMAMMDVDDLEGTVATAAAVVRAGGSLRVSMVNPCFPGNGAGLSSWPPDRGYSSEGYWESDDHNTAGVRIRVGSSHRTLSTYLNAFLAAGFTLTAVREPATTVPTWIVLAFEKPDPRRHDL